MTQQAITVQRPQIRMQDGRYVTSAEMYNDSIKRHLTVSVSLYYAKMFNIPYVRHFYEDQDKSDPLDKTGQQNPYNLILPINQVKEYYDTMREVRANDVEKVPINSPKIAEYKRLEKLDYDLTLYAVNDVKLKERVASEEERCKREKERVVSPMTKSNIYEMTPSEICNFLSHRVRHHNYCVALVAQILAQIKNAPTFNDNSRHIVKFLLSGPSGIGKNLMIRSVRQLCGMQPGGENEKASVKLSFNTATDQSQSNIIVGTGVGYIGFDQPCLVDRMCDALTFIQEKKTTATNQSRNHLIMLEIDEIDKGTNVLFTSLMEFLDRGCITSHKGRVFELPSDVTLLVCSSGNFAASYFNGLPDVTRGDEQYADTHATQAGFEIKKAMRAKGLEDWDIARLGRVLPLFPLNSQQATQILRFKLREFIACGGNYLPKLKMSMDMGDTDQETFVHYIVKHFYVKAQGIRQVEERMIEELEYNKVTQTEFITKHWNDVIPVPLAERPIIHFERIEGGAVDDVNTLERDPHMAIRDRDNRLNNHRLRCCIKQRCDIAYLMLHIPIINKYSIHILDAVTLQESMPLAASPARNTSPESDVDELAGSGGMKRTRDAYSGDIEDEIVYSTLKKKRKVGEASRLQIIEDERKGLVAPKTSGRPRLATPGYVYHDTKGGRTRYRCEKCNLVMDRRAMKKEHLCVKKGEPVTEEDDDDSDELRRYDVAEGFSIHDKVGRHIRYMCETCKCILDKKEITRIGHSCSDMTSGLTQHILLV